MNLDLILSPEARPFTVSMGIGLGLCLIEIVTFFAGASLSDLFEGLFSGGDDLDMDTDIDGEVSSGFVSTLFGLVNPSHVPFSMWLILALVSYGTVGFIGQNVFFTLGHPLPAIIAGPAAGVAALPVIRIFSQGLGAVLPKDHSEAIDAVDLVGHTGLLSIGPATIASPGRAVVRDQFGTPHNVRVIPIEPDEILQILDTVLLIDLLEDGVFRASKAPDHLTKEAGTDAASKNR